MVREFTEKRNWPSYDLARIQVLAESNRIAYASARSIESWLARLGYSHEHLRECIGMLTEDDFVKSGRYAIDGSRNTCWMDVYRLKTRYLPEGDSDEQPRQDDLYIKLSLSGGCVTVTVHSFHDWARQL
jgi:hypothetical protein